MIGAWGSLKKTRKIEQDISNHTRYCKCGHSMAFAKTAKKNKKICHYCGRLVYRSDIEEFRERLNMKIKKEANK